MKIGVVLCMAVAGAALSAVAALPLQDAKAKDDHAGGMGDPAAMARVMQAGAPGPQHKELAEMVGKWKCEMSYTMDPSMPLTPIKGTSTFTMLMDDRYLQEDHESSGPMGPFKGRGTTGYNNMTGEYESTWLDSMSTAIISMKGKADAAGDVTLTGEYMDPMTNALTTFRNVAHKVSADEHEFKMYSKRGDKPEFLSMTMKYAREK